MRRRRRQPDRRNYDVGTPILVQPQPTEHGIAVVVLPVITSEELPDFPVAGKATCWGDCGDWVWLTPDSYDHVVSGKVLGLCQQCAAKMLPPNAEPIGRLE